MENDLQLRNAEQSPLQRPNHASCGWQPFGKRCVSTIQHREGSCYTEDPTRWRFIIFSHIGFFSLLASITDVLPLLRWTSPSTVSCKISLAVGPDGHLPNAARQSSWAWQAISASCPALCSAMSSLSPRLVNQQILCCHIVFGGI
jgi:hypothetical protein